ncbi:hypothetical protein CLM82_24800 [Streptomyces albidoflavus]|nr:hypothetical protein CLM82_24800 [Streptomyces albidoflavus]
MDHLYASRRSCARHRSALRFPETQRSGRRPWSPQIGGGPIIGGSRRAGEGAEGGAGDAGGGGGGGGRDGPRPAGGRSGRGRVLRRVRWPEG